MFLDAEVYVDECFAMCHVGEYTGFSVLISKLVRLCENVASVRVNDIWCADCCLASRRIISDRFYITVVIYRITHI